MTDGDGKGSRSKGTEAESSQGLVGDLLRRATSPEVLAGVAGAAAAAHFTKHALEHEESDEQEAPPEPEAEESDEAEDETEEEPADDAQDEPDDESDEEPDAEPDAEPEDEPRAAAQDETEDEPEDRGAEEEEEEAEPADDEAEGGETTDESSEDSGADNGSLDSDDDRMKLLARARSYAQELTGHPVESFSGLAQEKRGWRIGVEVVELSRVPSTTDVIGSYELVLSDDGDFVDFRRSHRYYRNSTEDA